MTSDTVSGLADAERSSATIKAENILRQRLRITSLSPQEVAEGLRRFFPKQAAAMDREVSGLPSGLSDFYHQPRVVSTSTTSDTEFDRAKESIEQDLKALGTDNQLKEVDAELEGWGHAIRSLVAEGRSSALLATDPRSRDRALACRRQLSDYARMARLAGTFNPNANTAYRRLAQSIDQTAALILVSIGEAMAELGGSGGQVTLAAPLSELQARRDAVMSALRCLTGVNDDECGDFPRGVFALRMLHRWLDEGGHAELRAYLNENTLARAMDDLIDRAANGTGRGLRALGATASVALAPLERIVDIAGRQVDPESPTLSKLCNTLGLFIDAFRQNSGHRLLAIARPAIVHGGLHRTGSGDNGALRLQQIVGERGRLALQVDCLTSCDCAPDRMIAQIMLDGVVSGIDRAINLYALGTNPMADGEAERQAAAYGLLMSVIGGLALAPPAKPGTHERLIRDALNGRTDLLNCLGKLSTELLAGSAPPFPPAPNNPPPDHRSLLAERELESHWRSEVRWLDAAPRFGDACTPVINYKAAVQTVLIYALQLAGSAVTSLRQPKNDIPAAVATSQAKLAFNRPSTGF